MKTNRNTFVSFATYAVVMLSPVLASGIAQAGTLRNFTSGQACAEFPNASYSAYGVENNDSVSHDVQCPVSTTDLYGAAYAQVFVYDGGSYTTVTCELEGTYSTTSSTYKSGVAATSVWGTGQTSITTQSLAAPAPSQWKGLSLHCYLHANNPNDAVLGYWVFTPL